MVLSLIFRFRRHFVASVQSAQLCILTSNLFYLTYNYYYSYRKFEETTSLNTTVEETLSVLTAFSSNADQKLTVQEFALFITKFAKTTGANLSGMIDFMIVASALKHNSASEQKYIQSITTSDLYYWGS